MVLFFFIFPCDPRAFIRFLCFMAGLECSSNKNMSWPGNKFSLNGLPDVSNFLVFENVYPSCDMPFVVGLPEEIQLQQAMSCNGVVQFSARIPLMLAIE